MTTMPMVTGIVLERDHKDGTSDKGKHWDKYSYQIAGADGKHYYTSFDATSWSTLEKGSTWQIFYSETPNPNNTAYPYRNIEWWQAIEIDEATAANVQQTVEANPTRDERFRTKEELRWTEAWHMASRLGATYDPEKSELMAAKKGGGTSLASFLEWWANYFNTELVYRSGPPPTEPEPEWRDQRDGPSASDPVRPEPEPNPTYLVTQAVTGWNKDNPDNKITQDYLCNAIYRLYSKGEDTAKEAMAALTPEEAFELAGLIARGELARKLADVAVNAAEQGQESEPLF